MKQMIAILALAMLVSAGCGTDSDAYDPNDWPRLPIAEFSPQPFDYLGVYIGPEGYYSGLSYISPCAGSLSSETLGACIGAVTLDGAPADADALKSGQIVEMHGETFRPGQVPPPGYAPDTSPTVAVDIRRAIVGPIEAINPEGTQLTVLGQRVYLDYPMDPGTDIGGPVTVYGYATTDGRVLAKLIEPYAGESLSLVRGTLVERSPGQLTIGELGIDFANALRENFPGGEPLAGDTVLVMANEPPVNGVLVASSIRCTGSCESGRWGTGDMTGFLTAWRSPADFDIDGVAVRPVTCECVYGNPPPVDSFVNVTLYDGYAEITRAASTSHRTSVTGAVSAADDGAGEIGVLGYRIRVTPATQMAESVDSYPGYGSLTLDELSPGDGVQIAGQIFGDVIVAGAITRDSSEPSVRSADFVVAQPVITVAGRDILTDANTTVGSCTGGALTLDEFFSIDWTPGGTSLLLRLVPEAMPLLAERIVLWNYYCD